MASLVSPTQVLVLSTTPLPKLHSVPQVKLRTLPVWPQRRCSTEPFCFLLFGNSNSDGAGTVGGGCAEVDGCGAASARGTHLATARPIGAAGGAADFVAPRPARGTPQRPPQRLGTASAPDCARRSRPALRGLPRLPPVCGADLAAACRICAGPLPGRWVVWTMSGASV